MQSFSLPPSLSPSFDWNPWRDVTRPQEPDALDSLKMEVGIEDCLHIEFEYDKSAYHLQDVVIGKVRSSVKPRDIFCRSHACLPSLLAEEAKEKNSLDHDAERVMLLLSNLDPSSAVQFPHVFADGCLKWISRYFVPVQHTFPQAWGEIVFFFQTVS